MLAAAELTASTGEVRIVAAHLSVRRCDRALRHMPGGFQGAASVVRQEVRNHRGLCALWEFRTEKSINKPRKSGQSAISGHLLLEDNEAHMYQALNVA
jgi:hypothetical protein